MVNGQTGKMVGSVPCDKKKTWIIFILLTLVTSSPFLTFSWLFLDAMEKNVTGKPGSDLSGLGIAYGLFVLSLMALGSVALLCKSIKKLKSFKESVKRTQSSRTNKYVKERQDR